MSCEVRFHRQFFLSHPTPKGHCLVSKSCIGKKSLLTDILNLGVDDERPEEKTQFL